jgi:hypothetical protein
MVPAAAAIAPAGLVVRTLEPLRRQHQYFVALDDIVPDRERRRPHAAAERICGGAEVAMQHQYQRSRTRRRGIGSRQDVFALLAATGDAAGLQVRRAGVER